MNFFKYMVTNGLWYFVGFLAFVAVFVWVSSFFGDVHDEIKWVILAGLILTTIFLGGNYVAWKKLH